MKGGDTVGTGSRRYDAGKKANGWKGFIVTDTLGLLVTVWVLAASWQDRDGAKSALVATSLAAPSMRQKGFAVHPRRWVVERTFAWLTAHRRLARDYERIPEVPEAIICLAAIAGMDRRITRGTPVRRQAPRTFTWS
ncbi:hypothetical protein Asi02nite_65030 [Asanoa siamensis]|uniref:Transposase DDE domain-containing protein n=1 Tax=Asanoa siamensis TaxID=926357 RepID=A0ABQ4D0C5_9ACTN|nr:transposase [Asanoa siamensis]GIF76985.1 hypothetical protein Asi02nite_65030 [Asanoa siamensis]